MKANDFRIGNLMDNFGVTCYVMSINKAYAEFGYYEDSAGFKRIYESNIFPNPIPLTEEWLLKLPDELNIPSWIKFVHQLQNWYWVENKCEKELLFNDFKKG